MNWENDGDTAIIDRTDIDDDIDIQEPRDFCLLFINDNYTTMEFVVMILMQICHKSKQEAEIIMQDVHNKGKGVGFIGIEDIVRTKQLQVKAAAQQFGFPLRTEVEEM